MHSINPSTNNYERYGAQATANGFRHGSGEWWKELRRLRDLDNQDKIDDMNGVVHPTMQIRKHRGGLDESVASMQTIPATIHAVKKYMEETQPFMFALKPEELDSVEIKVYDPRPEQRIPGWDGPSYMITYIYGQSDRVPFGFCSKDPNNLPKEEPNVKVNLDPELEKVIDENTPMPEKVIGIDTPNLQPKTPEQSLDRGQEYIRKMFRSLIRASVGGSVLEVALQSVLGHKAFQRWTTVTREERETGLPEDIRDDIDEIDRRLADVRYLFEQLMPMVTDVKHLDNWFPAMRNRGINIYNEPDGDVQKYYIGIRGDWGWLHLYNGN